MREVIGTLAAPTVALCDVRTRFADAPRLYGPQKGASPEDVEELERRFAAMQDLAPYADLPGSGSAGGLGAAFAALGARLVPGARWLLEHIDFRAYLRDADLAISGEGRLDETTLEGKAPWEARRMAEEEGVRCALFGGLVELDEPDAHALSGDPGRAIEDLRVLGRTLAA
jgi:glycerate kinase